MRQTPVNFKSKGLVLEGVVSLPQGLPGPLPGAVLCHPHPLFGGSMDNPVVMALALALAEAGIATFRFNFRGVGDSQGVFSKGEEEPQDLRSALDLLKGWPGIDRKRLALVGYSFGGQVVLLGLRGYRAARALALVSPPLSSFPKSTVDRDKRPKLFLVGERDRLVEASRLQEQVAGFPVPGTVEVVPGADHSWRGLEDELTQRVTRFLVQVL